MTSSSPIRDRTEQIVAAVVTFVDVTELRRAETAARQAAEFGEKLIGIVSHDLRNPLNAIHLSVTQLLHSETLSARDQRAAARIAKSTDRMKRMISELLDLTRAWCDPDDHLLQGHAVWHVVSAASLVFVFRHYYRMKWQV
jgi:signal transduction histidine kinase